jgi:hypothetical protein
VKAFLFSSNPMYDSVWAMSTMGGNYGLLAERAALGGGTVPSPPPTSEPSPPGPPLQVSSTLNFFETNMLAQDIRYGTVLQNHRPEYGTCLVARYNKYERYRDHSLIHSRFIAANHLSRRLFVLSSDSEQTRSFCYTAPSVL